MFVTIKTITDILSFKPKKEDLVSYLSEFAIWVAKDFFKVYLCEILYIYHNENDDYFWKNIVHFNKDNTPYMGQPYNTGLFGYIVNDKKPILIKNIKKRKKNITNLFDNSNIDSNFYFSIRKVSNEELIIPLIFLNNVIGLINVEAKDQQTIDLRKAKKLHSYSKYLSEILNHIYVFNNNACNDKVNFDKISSIVNERKIMPNCFKTGANCTYNISVDEYTIFIARPFNEEYDLIFNDFIKPVLDELELNSWKADNELRNIDLMCHICQGIQISKIALIDITTGNPNVLFELGLCYALGKKVILTKQRNATFHFATDILSMLYIQYEKGKDIEFKKKLKGLLTRIINED